MYREERGEPVGVGFEFFELRGKERGFDACVSTVEEEEVRDVICLNLKKISGDRVGLA